MARTPPYGFNVRRAQQARIAWNEPEQDEQEASTTNQLTPQSRAVGEVARHIRDQIQADSQLNDIWIEGEVRGFNRSGAGHYYFDLADAETDAALACVFFRKQNRGIRVEQGDQVLAHGSADLYLPRGSLQIIVDALRPIGEGVLQAEYERLFRNLEAEGLFNPDRKRPIPTIPHRVGVVTSPSGAVWHDIQQVVARRWPLAVLHLAPCLTQGAGAAESIAESIHQLNLLTIDEPDVIIVARGGGSTEDLWAYNEEAVARAIFASEIPVISAVGHETDITISDYVADRRAPTPSAAAEIAVPDRAEEALRVAGLRQAINLTIDEHLSQRSRQLAAQRERLGHGVPHPPTLRAELNRRSKELDQEIERRMTLLNATHAAALARLSALNPRRTLTRGYAIVSDAEGRVVTTAGALGRAERINLQFADGVVEATTASSSLPERR